MRRGSTISLFIGCILLLMFLIVSVYGNNCNLDEQKNARKDSLNSISIVPIQRIFPFSLLPMEIYLTSFSFREKTFGASDYACTQERQVRYPGFHGLAWLIEIPNDVGAKLVIPRTVAAQAARENKDRYKLIGDYLYDRKDNTEMRVDSTLDFFLAKIDLFNQTPETLSLMLVVSGPLWRQVESGQQAVGLFQTEPGKLQQGYVDFPLRHVLCFGKTDIDLLSPSGAPGESLTKEERRNIEYRAETSCETAFQIGPAYFDKTKDGESNKVGISGLALEKHRRNILIKMRKSNSTSLFLLSTVSNIGAFDAMVTIEALADELQQSIEWAVGLQSADFLSGPLVFDEEKRALPLSETNIPGGALLVFFRDSSN